MRCNSAASTIRGSTRLCFASQVKGHKLALLFQVFSVVVTGHYVSLCSAELHMSQFLSRRRAAPFMVQWADVLPDLSLSRSKSVLLEHHTGPQPYCSNLGSPFNKASSCCGVWGGGWREGHSKQPVTHTRARITDRKTQVYDPVRCGWMPAAYSQYPARHALVPFHSSDKLVPLGFWQLFCTYCDLKLCWLFWKNCKAVCIFNAGYFCNVVLIIGANCKSGS